jgi:hypothetical protein
MRHVKYAVLIGPTDEVISMNTMEMKEVVLEFANERGALPNLGCRRRYAAFGKASLDMYSVKMRLRLLALFENRDITESPPLVTRIFPITRTLNRL